MVNVVITGGAGFVGSRLARELLAAGSLGAAGAEARPVSQVTLVDKAAAPPDLAADQRVTTIQGDLGELLEPGRAGRDALAGADEAGPSGDHHVHHGASHLTGGRYSDLRVGAMSLTLCVLLWARPGAEDGLIAYEDQVLAMAADHQGRLLQRVRGSGADGQPLEVQLLEFASAQALDEFMADPRRQSLAAERDRVIAKTEVINVQVVS